VGWGTDACLLISRLVFQGMIRWLAVKIVKTIFLFCKLPSNKRKEEKKKYHY
jgi:hypothetical protein